MQFVNNIFVIVIVFWNKLHCFCHFFVFYISFHDRFRFFIIFFFILVYFHRNYKKFIFDIIVIQLFIIFAFSCNVSRIVLYEIKTRQKFIIAWKNYHWIKIQKRNNNKCFTFSISLSLIFFITFKCLIYDDFTIIEMIYRFVASNSFVFNFFATQFLNCNLNID